MSADSLRKQSKQGYHGQVILPQAINDPSIIESVAGFIHEVVPQAYSSVLPGESRDGILWARFDSTDYNDPDNFPQLGECESESTIPLVLVLGYSSGVQVWSIGGSGEATELLSWCQGAVRALRFLLKPFPRDPHSSKRPLVAIVDSSSPGPQFSTLSFISLKTAEVVKIIKFNSPICDVHCNRKSVVVTFNERIAVFDSATLEDRLTITTCYLSPGNSPNPIALGTRWLAYGEKRLTTWQRSSGGCEGDGAQSYTSAVIHAAKSLGKGLRELGGSLTGSTPQTSQNAHAQPGIVSVIDIERKGGASEEERGNMIAHFVAHTSAVVAMAFDPSGLLLITADRHGHRFNVFRIHPHPCTSQLAAVHHLYILHRGETTARVQDIAVSWDSRWVAISSVRGTTHVFPITPYGSLVTVRTHTTPHVVNRLSRFERSAGLKDGRGSPLPCEVPPTPPPPRLPPYPHPSVITPLAQLRARPDDSPLAATFGPPRAWLPGRPKSKRTCADSLYVISSSGVLLQYDLDPKCAQGIAKEKISYDTAIEVGVEAKAEWVLPKPPYTSSLCPPLPPGHILLDLPPKPQPPPDKWLSQVEIVTHTGPHRRLWMGPQFTFKSIDPLPMSGCEEGGIDSGNPLRSNPVNMPHRPYLLVETSSGGSVGSPQAESDEAGGRLREDLADAMLETQLGSGQARGKLRRAEVEWQVNPLGAVQTHPVAVVTHWPHPIFYEPFPVITLKEGPLATNARSQDSDTVEKSSETTDTIVDPVQLDKTDLYDIHKKQPISDIDISKSNEDVSEIIISELDEPEKYHGDCTYEVDCNTQLLDSYTTDTKKNTPDVLVNKLDSVNNSSKDQSEVSSSDKECAAGIEKSVVKSQEPEEKISKTANRKGRKKRNGNDKKGKKDLSKSFLIDHKNSELLPLPASSQKISEVKGVSENTTKFVNVEKIIKIADEESSEQINILSTADETNLSCDMDDSNLNSTESSSENKFITDEALHLEPRDDTQLVNLLPKEELHCDETENTQLSIGEEHLSDTNEDNQPKSNEGSNSESVDILVSGVGYFADVDINRNCESGANPPYPIESGANYKETDGRMESGSLPETDDQVLIKFDTSDVFPAIEEGVADSHGEIEDTTNNTSQGALELLIESDLNGNQPLAVTFKEESTREELLLSFESPKEGVGHPIVSGAQNYEAEYCPLVDLPTVSVEYTEPFITVPVKSSRSKNKRRKKEKRNIESSQLADISETDTSDSVVAKVQEITDVGYVQNYPEKISMDIDMASALEKDAKASELVVLSDATLVQEERGSIQEEAAESSEAIPESTLEDSTRSISFVSEVPPFVEEQIASTDRSEVEDISSHSGKESDDSKINKRERSRKQRRSESSDKDRSDSKKKSPSPATAKSESKDSESSDESGQVLEVKTIIPKIPKRKKGKKSDETSTEVQVKSKEESGGIVSAITEVAKEKSSDSSNDYSSERIVRKRNGNRSWGYVSNADQQRNSSVDDRDSVYESCNDDGASDSLAFESSKEDFDESSLKPTIAEVATSSNTEERTDSSDKMNQGAAKKVRKQKKKKR